MKNEKNIITVAIEAMRRDLIDTKLAIDDSNMHGGVESYVTNADPETPHDEVIEITNKIREMLPGRGMDTVYAEGDFFFIGLIGKRYRPAHEGGEILWLEETGKGDKS